MFKNEVKLQGNITRDIEVKESAKGRRYADFSVAVNNVMGGADFVPVAVFEQNVDKVLGLTKGSNIEVVGLIKTSNYEKNGVKIYSTKVVASDIVVHSTAGAK